MGLARLGSYSGNGSGDLIVTFSTAGTADDPDQTKPSPITPVASSEIDPLFEGTVEATEEAIVNAMVAATTMTGADGLRLFGLPHDELRAILQRYGRIAGKQENR
jgi:L-aminopeptidase/D-esterase-like protein